MTATEATILAAIIGVIGGAIGVIGTYIGAIRNIKRQEFNRAAAYFHDAFADVQFFLRQNIGKNIGTKKFIFHIINTKDLAKYERAISLFEPFLSDVEAGRFNRKWADYKRYMKATEEQWADNENPANTSFEKHLAVNSDLKLNLNQKYLDHIEDLLEYAKRK